jgi:RNA polymerase sigma factor (sigma-70 family)
VDTRAAVVADYDRQLMTRIACGSIDAFEALYDRYSARAYRMAWWVCHEDGRAEEAIQETFMSIWRGRTGCEPARGSVAAWLLTTVRSRAVDIVRHNTRPADRRAGEHASNAHPTPGTIAEQNVSEDATPAAGTVKGRMRLGLHELRTSFDTDVVECRGRFDCASRASRQTAVGTFNERIFMDLLLLLIIALVILSLAGGAFISPLVFLLLIVVVVLFMGPYRGRRSRL